MSCHEKSFTPYQREAIAKVRALLGDTGFSYEKNANNHMQIKVDGIERVFHTGATPSDFRSIHNFIGDIRAELNRLNPQNTCQLKPGELPESQMKAKAKKSACDLVKAQSKKLQKQLKRNLRTIRKEEFKMLTQLQDEQAGDLPNDLLADSIRQYRRQQIEPALDQLISQNKGDLFITPGPIKQAKTELEEYLDSNLASIAEYRDRLDKRLERRIKTGKAVIGNLLNEACANEALAEPAGKDSVVSTDDVTGEPEAAPACAEVAEVPQAVVAETPVAAVTEPAQAAKAEAQSTLTELVAEKPYKRIAALKALEKEQIRQLMADCEKALNQKHQEDIHYLIAEMQNRGISLDELQQSLTAG